MQEPHSPFADASAEPSAVPHSTQDTSLSGPDSHHDVADDLLDDAFVEEPIEDLIARARTRAAGIEGDTWLNDGPSRRDRLHAVRSGLVPSWFRTRGAGALCVLGACGGMAIVAVMTTGSRSQSVTAGPAKMPAASSTTFERSTSRGRAPRKPPIGIASLPAGVRSTCRGAPGLARQGQAAVCEISTGVLLEIRWLPNAVQAQMVATALMESLRAANTGRCRDAIAPPSAPRSWSPRSAEMPQGWFVCGRSARGAEVVWTVDARHVVAVVVRSDGDIDAALRWWDASPAVI